MVNIIMHGCSGRMGQIISGLAASDENVNIVAGIDIVDNGNNSYPVFTNIKDCDVAADVIIDFASAKAVDALLDYVEERQMPVVLCTTGLSEEQLARVEEVSKKVAVLKSANMSLGINTLFKVLKSVAPLLAEAGFDIEVVEKHPVVLPDTIVGLVKCGNPKCITNNEPMTTIFHVIDKENGTVRISDPEASIDVGALGKRTIFSGIRGAYPKPEMLVGKGVQCLYPCGTTGEMLKLTTEERKAIAETVVRTAAGRVTVFIHTGAESEEKTLELDGAYEPVFTFGSAEVKDHVLTLGAQTLTVLK